MIYQLYWCLRLDSNQHIRRKPPPQGGVSTNFTTQAKKKPARPKTRRNVNKSDPAGIRTQDPYIKSVLLYQLSYRVGHLFKTNYLKKNSFLLSVFKVVQR